MFRIYPYKTGSRSVRTLKELLGGLIIKTRGSKYVPKEEHVIINWGNSMRPEWMTDEVHQRVINTPECVAIASDKLATFSVLDNAGVQTVPHTTDPDVAEHWAHSGGKIFIRHVLNGHSGEGIEVLHHDSKGEYLRQMSDELDVNGFHMLAEVLYSSSHDYEIVIPDAPLYTLGVENCGEYRVHVANGEVILYQKKSRRVDDNGEIDVAEGADADVRNLASNWVYRTGNLRRLERVEQLALDTIEAMGLDFGAVDIIMDGDGEVYVLEVNSAPGLGNTDTQEAYVNAFSNC